MDHRFKLVIYGFALAFGVGIFNNLALYLFNFLGGGGIGGVLTIGLLSPALCCLSFVAYIIAGFVLYRKDISDRDLVIDAMVFGVGAVFAGLLLMGVQVVLAALGLDVISQNQFLGSYSGNIGADYLGNMLGSVICAPVHVIIVGILYLIGAFIKRVFS